MSASTFYSYEITGYGNSVRLSAFAISQLDNDMYYHGITIDAELRRTYIKPALECVNRARIVRCGQLMSFSKSHFICGPASELWIVFLD